MKRYIFSYTPYHHPDDQAMIDIVSKFDGGKFTPNTWVFDSEDDILTIKKSLAQAANTKHSFIVAEVINFTSDSKDEDLANQ